MNKVLEVRARVYFLPTEEGGRHTPVSSGYSPGFDFGVVGNDGTKMQNGGMMIFEGQELILPGDECVVRIRPLVPELVQPVIRPNLEFNVMEGGRVVGRGTILEILVAPPEDGEHAAQGSKVVAQNR